MIPGYFGVHSSALIFKKLLVNDCYVFLFVFSEFLYLNVNYGKLLGIWYAA